MNKRLLLSLAASSLVLAACAVGPDYRAPATAPAVFHNADAAAFTPTRAEADWWKQFNDPVLDQLETRSLGANLDLRVAMDRVAEARALFKDADLDRLPRVTTAANYTDSKGQIPGSTDQRVHVQSYQVGFDAAWELDLFGRVSRGIEAARADAQATEADLRDAQVTLAAEVARTYFELRGAQDRLALAQRNLQTERDTLRITRARFDVGQGDPVDVASATARLSAVEATIPPLNTAEKRAAYRLAVLAGERPGELDIDVAARTAPPAPFARPLPIGDAAALLRRRPDVQAAERRLAAETARVGVATADLFPRVSVTGFLGFLSGDLSALGGGGSKAWSVSPTVSWPGLDMGGARARLKAQEARADASLATYDKTVLGVLEEVENAFVAYGQQQAQLKSLVDQATASRRAADLARIRYREGTIDFLVLLDAERTSIEADDAVSVAETAVNTDVAAIYKALGGGWTDDVQVAKAGEAPAS
jgi:multidrug efflux system outer membrane protein